MGLDTSETCKGWRNILKINCESSWFFLHDYIEMHSQQNIRRWKLYTIRWTPRHIPKEVPQEWARRGISGTKGDRVQGAQCISFPYAPLSKCWSLVKILANWPGNKCRKSPGFRVCTVAFITFRIYVVSVKFHDHRISWKSNQHFLSFYCCIVHYGIYILFTHQQIHFY